MGVVQPISYQTPDDVERELRFTAGSRRRIAERFGSPDIRVVLNEHDAGAIPGLLYSCLFDSQGQPPNDLTEAQLAEMLPGDEADDQLATFFTAMAQGRKEKKEFLAMIREVLQIGEPNSANSGVSQLIPPASASPIPISGGDSPKPNSNTVLTPTSTENGSPTTAPASSPLQSAT